MVFNNTSIFRIMKNRLAREQERLLKQQEREKIQQLHEVHLWEKRKEQEQQKEERKQLMQAHQVQCAAGIFIIAM